ncbi:hypothetical protein M7I_3294 [Glarea lozoyensis 74030]|uniref:Uncharacterized protein n=1 Tax=Glarea lozoyensis (strain ATCC 74030 / MF5533) TaxID=1104152 RepID=H0EKN9_GLAL7|nr:hypothetical protein M7I_3294 [Glarea lozoyensis 74030]
MALAQDIEKALKESLELLDLERLEYEPATREQHRIQSAYVEDLTAEPGYHSKEDDKFFFEEAFDFAVWELEQTKQELVIGFAEECWDGTITEEECV